MLSDHGMPSSPKWGWGVKIPEKKSRGRFWREVLWEVGLVLPGRRARELTR